MRANYEKISLGQSADIRKINKQKIKKKLPKFYFIQTI